MIEFPVEIKVLLISKLRNYFRVTAGLIAVCGIREQGI